MTLAPATQTSTGEMVVDPGGDVDVLRADLTSDTENIVSATRDVAGPALNGLSVPASGTVGVPVTFSVAPVDAWSPIGATIWDFGDGQSLPDETVSHTYAAPGTYTVRTTSSDTLGNTTTKRSPIIIRSAGSTHGTGTTLTLRRVTETHRRWREDVHGRRLAAAIRRIPVGTQFGFTVNQAARVTVTFRQLLPGRRLHRRCRALTRRNRRDPRCAHIVKRGALHVRMTAAGRHILRFAGRIGSHHLAAGRYTVTVLATGSGGSATRRLHFTVAKL